MKIVKRHQQIVQFAAIGWTIAAFGILQLPLWATHAVVKAKGTTLGEKIASALRPTDNWGPKDPATYERYRKYVSNFESSQAHLDCSISARIKRNLFG